MRHDQRIQGVYFITDRGFREKWQRTISDEVRAAIAAGVKIIQYREKDAPYAQCLEEARQLRRILQPGTLFIVNDNVLLAKEADADGVHLGQGDMPLLQARRILGPTKVIGISVQTYEQALVAVHQGADYLGIGPVFATATKKDAAASIGLPALERIIRAISIPTIAIGGIQEENFDSVVRTGVGGVAMISAILDNPDVQRTIASYQRRLLAYDSQRAGAY